MFFPAGPALVNIEKSKKYYQSLRYADLVFFDSGFFVLLLRFFKNINVQKFSDLNFLIYFFHTLKEKIKKKVFLR